MGRGNSQPGHAAIASRLRSEQLDRRVGEDVSWSETFISARAPEWIGTHGFAGVYSDSLDVMLWAGEAGLSSVAHGWIDPDDVSDVEAGGPLDLQRTSANLSAAASAAVLDLIRARPVVVDPDQVAALPEWESDRELVAYAAMAQPPFDVTYFDMTDTAGRRVSVEIPDEERRVELAGALVKTWPTGGLAIQPFCYIEGADNVPVCAPMPTVVFGMTAQIPPPTPGLVAYDIEIGEMRTTSPTDLRFEAARWNNITAYLAPVALNALYLLDSPSVDLTAAPVSRQVRRQLERKGVTSRIANVISIQAPRAATPPDARGSAEYSHRFEVRGHWKHYTSGPVFAKGAQPCPRCGSCRRVWQPPFVKGPADKPLKLKTRLFAAAASPR